MVTRLRVTEPQLITQCYLPPNTGECSPVPTLTRAK